MMRVLRDGLSVSRTLVMRGSFFLLAVLVAATPAHSLSCGDTQHTLREAYESADSIIVGLVTGCEEAVSSESWVTGGADCSFSSLEVLKASTPPRDYSGLASSRACGLSLRRGNKYLLFLDSDNDPMHFSEPLDSEPPTSDMGHNYLRVLRDFRDGVVSGLAEPWIFREIGGMCIAFHTVDGNQIRFQRAGPHFTRRHRPEWALAMRGGQEVYKVVKPALLLDSGSIIGSSATTVCGGEPDLSNPLMLSVHLRGESLSLAREVTLSVDDQVWQLTRMETENTVHDSPASTRVSYFASDDPAEDILSAMATPAEIVVTAVMVEPSMGVSRYSTRPEPAGGNIRIDSRSTHLAHIIKGFRSCYASDE